MAIFEVTLVHKEKITVPANDAGDAIDKVMKDIETGKPTFTPNSWAVKEKVEVEKE